MSDWLTANRKLVIALAAPLAVVLVFDLFVVRPRAAAGRRAADQTVALRMRLSAVPRGPSMADARAPEIAGRPDAAIQEFEQRVPAADRVPDLLERVARLALDSASGQEIRALKIETGERVNLGMPDAQRGPRVANDAAAQPDPRLGLFAASLAYTNISISFDATYPALGRLLWNLRDLPTTVEIRSLDVSRPAAATDGGLLRVEIGLFAFQRSGSKTL